MPALIDATQAAIAMEAVSLGDHARTFLGCQLSAAFEAAAFQNVLAGFAGHALHKAMLASSRAFFGLVGSFRHTDNYTVVTPVCKVAYIETLYTLC